MKRSEGAPIENHALLKARAWFLRSLGPLEVSRKAPKMPPRSPRVPRGRVKGTPKITINAPRVSQKCSEELQNWSEDTLEVILGTSIGEKMLPYMKRSEGAPIENHPLLKARAWFLRSQGLLEVFRKALKMTLGSPRVPRGTAKVISWIPTSAPRAPRSAPTNSTSGPKTS